MGLKNKMLFTTSLLGMLYHAHAQTTDTSSLREPEYEIALSQALSLALLHNPALAAFSWEMRMGEALELQASQRPNPELHLEVEDFAGSGNYGGLDASQTTVQISQSLEIGGKRSARKRMASGAREKAGLAYEVMRREVLRKTTLAYIEVVAAQRGLALAGEVVSLAEQTAGAASARARAGKASAAEESKAKAAIASAQIDSVWAKHRLDEAREGLSALWDNTEPRFQSAQDGLDSVFAPPTLASLLPALQENPELAGFSAESLQLRAAVDVEKANAVPNLSVKGGYRRIAETGDHAVVAGVSVPLPLWNRNRGRIAETRHKSSQVEKRKRAAEVDLRLKLAEAHDVAVTAHAEIGLLRNGVLPGAQSAHTAMTQGYQQGRYGYLEILDAQKTLASARAQYLRALSDFHRAIAEIESLTGRPVKS